MAHETLHKNWMRAANGFKYLKEGLINFVSNEVGKRHIFLKQTVAQHCNNVSPCVECMASNLLPEHGNKCNLKYKRDCFCQQQRSNRRKCPNNFCSYFYHLIVEDHVERNPCWKNADFTKWYDEYIQYAKCFLGSPSTANSMIEIDCAGLLSIVINNKTICNSVDDVELFKQSRSDRNNIFHPKDYAVTESELKEYIDNMINILQDKKCLINDKCAQMAITQLEKLKKDQIYFTDEEISELKKIAKDVKEKEQQKRSLEDLNVTTEQKRIKIDDKMSIRKKLKEIYRHDCSTLQVSPLFNDQDMDLLKVYANPSMRHLPYHGDKKQQTEYEIKSYKDIFCRDNQLYRNIYVTGDAGVGKTSFCKRMSLLWCMEKNGDNVPENMTEDIEHMKLFDFVFYVTLRQTAQKHVTEMILEQLFDNDRDMYTTIDRILGDDKCLVLLDGYDEWTPDKADRNWCEIPERRHADKCVYVTTCRPHKIQTVRLPHKDIDQQILITGLREDSIRHYAEQVIQYVNQENNENKSLYDFLNTMNECGLYDQLSIPILASHLVVLWFELPLTKMPRALIFSHCLKMLFDKARDKIAKYPQTQHIPELQLPDSFTKVIDVKEHESLLQTLCIFSFKLLFKGKSPNFVFTSDQLGSEPFNLSEDKQELLCKIGIVSKKKEIGISTKQKLKLSFLHRSYAELLAALYVSSSESCDDIIDAVIKKGPKVHPLYEFLQLENFLLLLSGLSFDKVIKLFDRLYSSMSDAFKECREKSIFHADKRKYRQRLESIQDMVFKCVKEAHIDKRSPSTVRLKLNDFIIKNKCDDEMLRLLLKSNTQCTKSILVENGNYLSEFDAIKAVCHLRVRKLPYDDHHYDKFLKFMLQNQETLLSVCIVGVIKQPFISEIPVKCLSKLTALSLSYVKLPHRIFQNLILFLSDNVLFENIKLNKVYCYNHTDCEGTLNVKRHTKLTSLYLSDVDIFCQGVPSCLSSLTLYPRSQKIAAQYIEIFGSMQDTSLEFLRLKYRHWSGTRTSSDDEIMNSLMIAVHSQPTLRCLHLSFITVPNNMELQLDSSVQHIEINLDTVKLSDKCFKEFIKCLNNKTFVVILNSCIIVSHEGKTHDLSPEDSVTNMSDYLTTLPKINITSKGSKHLFIERTK